MTNKSSEFQITIDTEQIQKEYFKDLFRYRELFFFLAWRDIIVRYKQALLGVLWSIIRPLLNMVVFAYIFGRVANLPSEGVNYSLFVLAGLLPWQFFSSSLVDGSQCLVGQAQIISKTYFPRIILPASNIFPNFLDFAISLVIMFMAIGMMGYMSWRLFYLPLLVGLLFMLCLGASLWTSALMVRYRDVRFIVPFIVQFGLFLSPVGYGSFLISEPYRTIYYLNPIAGIIEGFRWCFFGVNGESLPLSLGLSVAVNCLIFYFGFRFFRKMERLLADII